METTGLYLLLAGGIFLFVCQQDRNVPDYLILRYKLAKLDVVRWFWGLKLRWQIRQSLKEMRKNAKKF